MSWYSNLARDFNVNKWWKYYTKAQKKNGVLKLYYTFKYMKMASKNGGYVGRETVFLGKPNLPHGFHGVHISRRATVGMNCTILQNVTIGSVDGRGATIGNDVLIGAGANIVGEIIIGDNVKIGAGTTVFEDIPSGCTVVGQRPRVITKN